MSSLNCSLAEETKGYQMWGVLEWFRFLWENLMVVILWKEREGICKESVTICCEDILKLRPDD